MKKLFFLFSAFLMMLLTSCSDERDFGNGYAWEFPINETDSLAMVKIYKAMGYDSWTDKNNIDLKKRETWDGECTLKFDKENKEFRIVSLSISFVSLTSFPEFQGVFVIPDEVSQMTRLKSAHFRGSEEVTISNVAALADCPLEYLTINYGEISEKDLFEALPKLSGTLTLLRINHSGLNGSQEWTLKLPNLENLDLSDNEYSGLDESLAWTQKLPNLEILNLSDNKYSGKVPDIFKYCEFAVGLMNNNYNEMDWSYFTDANVKRVPEFQGNRLHGVIPQEVFDSNNWKYFRHTIHCQQKGYGYTNWRDYY